MTEITASTAKQIYDKAVSLGYTPDQVVLGNGRMAVDVARGPVWRRITIMEDGTLFLVTYNMDQCRSMEPRSITLEGIEEWLKTE